MKIGYARVSTDEQRLQLQIDALERAGCKRIYQEYQSGKTAKDRPELNACLKALRENDTLIVWRLDRLGRSLIDLISIVTELDKYGVGFESITEKIDTTTPTGSFVFHLFSALAEFERNLIRERTKAGLAAARSRGRMGGRKPKLSDTDVLSIKTLMSANELTIIEIAKLFNVSRNTLYRAVRKLAQQGAKSTF